MNKIDWIKVRDAILYSDICDVEEDINAWIPENTYTHSDLTVGDIIDVVKKEIEKQLK